MTQIYPHIQPEVEKWPVAIQSNNRSNFIKELNDFAFNNITVEHGSNLYDLISKAIYLENQRIKLNPWKVDPPDEKSYWKTISTDLEASLQREDKEDVQIELLKKIVNRYNEEIVGHFSPKIFKFSRHFLTSFFKRIFCKFFDTGKWRWGSKSDLQQRIKVIGDVEKIRELFKKGTVVILPTHYSNLDSIMVGYAMDTNIGLPFFSYGAGLNLYNVEIVGYFINRLGAFRVDRRKKNPIYLECLKSMTGYSIIDGVNCIFFPGGTRSRSGQTEDKVKLGLISSLIEAQRIHLEQNNQKKIFVVPLNIGYHFVLEAPHLIDQHLQHVGRDKYKRRKQLGPSFGSIYRFIRDIYTKSSEVYMSFGEPLDVFGNIVDYEGNSFDKFGNKVDTKDYFTFDGALSSNSQRESVYAKLLGETVVASYKKFNVILSSNVVAFTAFHVLMKEFKDLDFIHLVNQKDQIYIISGDDFEQSLSMIVKLIKEMNSKDQVTISDENWDDISSIINIGLTKLGIYHGYPILKKEKNNTLQCRDIKLLYFYHNRLINYGLEELMDWQKH